MVPSPSLPSPPPARRLQLYVLQEQTCVNLPACTLNTIYRMFSPQMTNSLNSLRSGSRYPHSYTGNKFPLSPLECFPLLEQNLDFWV